MDNSIRHIVFFNSTKAWGGGEKWHFEMAVELHARGFHITFFCHEEGALRKKLEKTDIRVIPVKISNTSFLNPFSQRSLKKQLLESKAKSIVMNLSADVKSAGRAARDAGFRNVIYRRGSAIPIRNTWFNRYLFGKVVTDILANSEATKETILANNKSIFPKEKIKVIYNGLSFSEPDSEVDQKHFTTGSDFVLGNAGRLEEQKNQSDLIKLSAELNKRDINHRILIAGEGRLKQQLLDLSCQYQVEKHIVFMGFKQDLNQFYKSIDLFILTSKWEGFGYVLAEAMMHKKAVLAYDLSSNKELIENGKNGFLTEPLNIKALADKVEMLASNKELLKHMGDAGRKMALSRFDFKKNVQLFIDWLQHIEKSEGIA